MMKTINFAVFGCGVIAGIHAAAIADVEGAVLVGCADAVPAAAEKFADRWGVRTYPDFEALINSPDIDAISICTPSGTHAELAIRALERDKNVVLEKPMAITVADCDRVIAAALKSRGKITVISQLRTSPDVLRAREIVRSGKLGKIVLVELNMRYYRAPEYFIGSWRGTKKMDGGGALMNQGIHGVDLLQYIAGPVMNIKSIVRTLSHNIEVEDTAVAAIELQSGAIGVIVASTAAHPGFDREIRINGTRGAIELREDKLVRIVIDGVDEPCEEYTSQGTASNNAALAHAGHARQIAAFVEAINSGTRPAVDEHEGRVAVEIIERIYRDSN